MLILTRTIDESIMIDDDIEIVVLGIERGRVRLGISGPRERIIHRKEIYLRIKAAAQRAATQGEST